MFAYWLFGGGTVAYSYNPTLSVPADKDYDINDFRAVFCLKSDYASVVAGDVEFGFVDNPGEWACAFAGGTATVAGLKAKKKLKTGTFLALADDAYRPVTFTFKNLPKGLSVNKYTGTLSGTPAQKGTYTATLTVTLTAKPSVKKTAKVKVVVK